MITKKIIAKGKVQGVFYRQSALKKAKELNVTGTVQNLADGKTVSIIATGSSAQVTAFIEWCRQGPPNAVVINLEITEIPYHQFSDFSILR